MIKLKKLLFWVGMLALFVLVGCDKYPITGDAVKTTGTKEIKINAFQFGYTPNEIVVNKGDKVKITINNTDTLHGIRIPDLGIKGNDVLEFTADKTGEFVWYCANMCGKDHMQMKGRLIVE